jgi:hypothetical protein
MSKNSATRLFRAEAGDTKFIIHIICSRVNLGADAENVREVNTSEEHDESAELATHWYKMPKDWCKNLLAEWHAAGEVITHSFIKYNDKMVATCMAAPNNVRKDTAAMYFVYVK